MYRELKHLTERLSLFILLVAVTTTLPVNVLAGDAGADSTAADPTSLLAGAPMEAGPGSSFTTDRESEAPSSPWSFSADVTLASRYLFQGFDYSDGRPVMQPSASVGHGAFSVSAWSNFDIDGSEFNEFDFTFAWSGTWKALSLTTGYMNLVYPNREDWDPSQEMLIEGAIEAPLSPSFSWHYDFDAGNGSYASLGLSQGFGSLFTGGVTLYYQDHYYEVTGIPALEISVGAEVPVAPFTLSPAISRLVTWENGDFRDGAGPDDNWLFGLTLAREF